MKKVFTIIFCSFFVLQSKAQFNTIYENSFRNWQPGQGWVFLNNDTIQQGPGLVTTSYLGETYDYMLGTNVLQGLSDKIMFSPPIALSGNPWLTVYTKSNSPTFTAWVVTNENDTTLTGLTNSLGTCLQNGFNGFNLSAYNNDTVRIAFRLQGTNASGIIDNFRILDKISLGWIPDSCFRNYMKSMIPSAFVGDSLNYLHAHALNRTQIVYPNNCVQSLEGLQFFPFIRYINMHNGLISFIPTNTLYYLDSMNFENNLISALPNVPICTVLRLDNNLLRKIPDINNQQVSFFHARNNLIYDCLQPSNRFVWGDFYNNVLVYFVPSWYYSNPNYYSGMGPLPNCSQAIGHINGRVYFDVNQDSVFNAGDYPIGSQRIDFLPGPDIFSVTYGMYGVTVDTGLVDMNVTSLPPWLVCITPLHDTLGLQETIQHDFRIVIANPAHDVSVNVTTNGPARLGENLLVNLNARNYGTNVSPATVKMYLSPGYTLISLGAGTINNDTLTWTPLLNPLSSANNIILMRIDSFPVNVQHTFLASADTTGDVRAWNNMDSVSVWIWDSLITVPPQPVGYPFDANNKLVTTPIVAPGFSDYLTYNINFENTGTANATHVVVKDILPTELDPQTFQFIASTHPCTISMGNDSMFVFTFYPITLTTKSQDSLHCDGSLWFRIKPKSPVQLNDTIRNVASIYFDTIPAVVTQNCDVWADTTYILTSGNIKSNDHLLYPNPTTGIITINNMTDHSICNVIVVNPLGQVLKVFDKIQSGNNFRIDIGDLPEGIYFVVVNDEKGSRSFRVLKQN